MRGALGKHELAQRLHCKTTAADAAYGGEAGVVPTAHETSVDEPMELALGEERIDEVETTAYCLSTSAQVRGRGDLT